MFDLPNLSRGFHQIEELLLHGRKTVVSHMVGLIIY